jgi:pimeloyl-ACP methyl ester carboxylesterase
VATLAYTRTGAGAPLMLLHGLGSARHVWEPVLPALSVRFDVVAVDLPGFGASAPLLCEPHPAALAAAVAGLLDDLGLAAPHVAGNSLGGWVALELARIRPVASLTLLSPAGLWPGRPPRYPRISLQLTRWLTRHAARPLSRLVDLGPGRVIVLGQTHGRPARVTPEQARAAIRAMGTCPGFDAALHAAATRRYRSGPPVDAPVTVAFGSRDLLLLRRQARHFGELPPGTTVAPLPGCGHVPTYDDPAAVADLVVATARRSGSGSATGREQQAAAGSAG